MSAFALGGRAGFADRPVPNHNSISKQHCRGKGRGGQSLSLLEGASQGVASEARRRHLNRRALLTAQREEAADAERARTAIDPQEQAEFRASAAMFRAVARALEVAR